MRKWRWKSTRTHFTELSPCHPKGLPHARPLRRKAAPGVPSVSRLWAMWPATQGQRQTRNEFWPCCSHTWHSSLRGDHLQRQGPSSSCALLQIPKVKEPELVFKARKTNTFDRDYIHQYSPRVLTLNFAQNPSLLKSNPVIWIPNGGILVYSWSSIFKINIYQTYKLNQNTQLIFWHSCPCQSVGGKRPFNKWPGNKSLSKQKT